MTQIEALINTEPTKGRKETILVVDDDPIVLDYVSLVACRSGYSVLGAKSGEVAVKLSQTCGTIDLLLTDFEMAPGMNGVATARRITAARPSTRVLVMSGRDRDQINLPENMRFIQKPFASAALLDLVAEILLPSKVPVHRQQAKPSSEDRKEGRA